MKRRVWHLTSVRPVTVIQFVLVCLALLLQPIAQAQTSFSAFGHNGGAHHTHVKLLLSADEARAGDTVLVGVDMKMDPGWHTYWKNPGEAGSPTKVEWTLPAGVSAGDIQWPLPSKLPPADITTYGYEDENMLVVPITLGPNVSAGPLKLTAKVSWLECKDSCIPADTTVEATLTIGTESKASTDAAIIDSWKSKTPQKGDGLSIKAMWEKPADGDTRPLLISYKTANAAAGTKYDSVDFFPVAYDNFDIQSATEVLSASADDVRIRKLVKKFSGDWPAEIDGTFVTESGQNRSGYDVGLKVGDGSETKPTAVATVSTPQMSAQDLLLNLALAFVGGLILNLMPCVLPVIALKILGFVSEAHSEPGRVRKLGYVYSLGVLTSFLALAGLVIGLRAAGLHAGWGMQFGSPIFVVCLTTLVLLVALNLFGVFEVTLGGRAFDSASSLASKSGSAGAFFNGVLATTLATPCTAPFLAPALGFAFQQSPGVILLIFLTVGVGLSVPYVILSSHPAWLKFLPKPGAWMEKFKIAMGFPMLATVVWLFNVAAADYGQRVFWLGVFLVILAFAAWIFGEFFQRGSKRSSTALVIVLILIGGGYAWALESQLHWREAAAQPDAGSLPSDGLGWQPWSPEAVSAARAAGKPVLVDFTAAWCVTCNAVVKPGIENDSVVSKLKELGAVTLLADYTRTPPEITKEIAKYGVAGVPLVLVYPKTADAPPIILSQPSPLQLPSSYSKVILDALDRAK